MIEEKSENTPKGLTNQQHEHLHRLIIAMSKMTDAKYRAGAAEHGGFLGDNDPIALIDLAIDETIDQFVYLYTVREKLVRSTEWPAESLNPPPTKRWFEVQQPASIFATVAHILRDAADAMQFLSQTHVLTPANQTNEAQLGRDAANIAGKQYSNTVKGPGLR